MRIIHTTLKTLKRIPRWVYSVLFFGLIVVFLLLYIQSIDTKKLSEVSVDWQLFAIACVLGLAFRYLGAYIWRVILRRLGANHLPGSAVTNDVYAKAWMGRYIPGTVTWIAGKVYMASSWGISKSRLAVASLLEGGSQVVAITFVSFLLLAFDPRLDALSPAAKVSLIVLGLLVLIVLIPQIFNRLMRQAMTIVKRQTISDELQINGPAVWQSFALYALGTLLSGASAFFAIWSIAPQLQLSDLGFVIGSFGLASVAGMAAPFAPSGLGIRDGIQLVLLTAILPRELALVATIWVRLWSVALDVAFLGLTRFSLAIVNKFSTKAGS